MVRGDAAARSAATRYLCVGAELDELFARTVIRELLTERHRAVAPSYGIDVVPIVQHCLRAERRRAVRDAVLSALVAAELLVAPLPALLVIVVAAWARWAQGRAGAVGRAVSLLLGIGICVAAVGAWAQFRGPISAALPPRLLDVAGIGHLPAFLVSLPIVLLLTGLICYTEWFMSRSLVGRELRADTFDPYSVPFHASRRTMARLETMGRQQYAIVTIYHSAADDPFVGAGSVDTDSAWSFATDLHRAPDRLLNGSQEVTPFTPWQLHQYIEKRLWALTDPGLQPSYFLRDLEIQDHLLMNGMTVWSDLSIQDMLLWRPTQQQVEHITDLPEGPVRHFKSIRVEAWGRELVTNIFLHLSTEGRTLYIEFTPCLLPPILPEYHLVDTWPFPSSTERGRAVRAAWGGSVAALLDAPTRLLRWWQRATESSTRANELRRSSDRGYVFDYGARTSVRQLGAVAKPDHYFQMLDARRYLKVIEIQVLTAIADFLEDHGVDTAELRARQTAILNNGIINTGTNFGSQSVASGKDVKVSQRQDTGQPRTGQPVPS